MTTVLLAARLESKRLPRKILADICGKPMLARVIERAQKVGQVILCVPDQKTWDEIYPVVGEFGCEYYDGYPDDPLARLVYAASDHDVQYAANKTKYIRITHDCPLLMPEISNKVVSLLTPKYDYVSNVDPRGYPRGLDTEAFWYDTLLRLDRMTEGEDRQHVTLLPRNNHDRFVTNSLVGNTPEYRWCVDTQEDLDFVRLVYAECGPDADYETVRKWCDENPEYARLDDHP